MLVSGAPLTPFRTSTAFEGSEVMTMWRDSWSAGSVSVPDSWNGSLMDSSVSEIGPAVVAVGEEPGCCC